MLPGRELRSVLPTAREAQRRLAGIVQPQFGDLPLAVLSSHAWGGEQWVGMHRELAARSQVSTHRIFEDRFHNIRMQHADAVLDAVDEILHAAADCTAPR